MDRTPDPNSKLARVHSIFIPCNRREGTIVIRRLPSDRKFERSDTSGSDSVFRQRALVGDSPNDKQWGDGLFDPSWHQTTCPKVTVVGKHEPESRQGWA